MIVKTIKAQVNTKALLKNASSLFSGDFKDIATELLQNSRRAEASQVEITVDEDKITFKDNGTGIQDPSVVLNIATSNWDDEIVNSEHPAGMGVFSLAARKGVVIRSQDWTCELTPESFSGLEEVSVIKTEPIKGTSISFLLNDTELKAHYKGKSVWYYDLESLVRYYPVNVNINGEKAKQSSFLHEGGKCFYVKEWRGLNIGVTKNKSCGEINFYGLTILNSSLPSVYSRGNTGKYSVVIDVLNCPELQLVLPARKEVVINDFFDELLDECNCTIYEAIAQDRQGHYLSYEHYIEARRLGIDIYESKPLLREYSPYTSEEYAGDAGRFLGRLAPVTIDTVILNYSISENECADALFSEDENLYNYMSDFVERALHNSGLTDLREPDASMARYQWYKKLVNYKPVAIVAVDEGIETRIEEVKDLENIEADELYIEFLKYKLDNSISEETVRLEIPFILLDESRARYCGVSDKNILLIRNKNHEMPEYEDIKELLENLYFEYDTDGDSLDTQLNYFHTDARRWYISKFVDEKVALISHIRSICDEFLYDLRHAGYEADIKIRRVKSRHGTYDMKLEIDLIEVGI
jgi:hypothetical protein